MSLSSPTASPQHGQSWTDISLKVSRSPVGQPLHYCWTWSPVAYGQEGTKAGHNPQRTQDTDLHCRNPLGALWGLEPETLFPKHQETEGIELLPKGEMPDIFLSLRS